MINWALVWTVLLVLVLLAAGSAYIYLKTSDAGQLILARLGYDANAEALWALGTEYLDQGYIERETLIADRVARLDNVTLKGKFDYSQILQISTEARQKLQAIDPETVGQASRIPGVSPSDINILLALLGR